MAVLGSIGGNRDIMALRAGLTNAAAGYDVADAGYAAIVEAYDGYTQDDFEALGYPVDDAFFLADQLPKVKTLITTSADWAAIRAFADKTRDITR